MAVDELCELLDDLHVLDHLLADTGSLDLDGDRAAAAQHGPVNLAERGAGSRGLVEGLERLGDAGPDLGRDRLLDLVEGNRFNVAGIVRGVEVSDAVGSSVLDEERGDVLVAGEMLGLQGQGHACLSLPDPSGVEARRGRVTGRGGACAASVMR